jgi:hypothetical protein
MEIVNVILVRLLLWFVLWMRWDEIRREKKKKEKQEAHTGAHISIEWQLHRYEYRDISTGWSTR